MTPTGRNERLLHHTNTPLLHLLTHPLLHLCPPATYGMTPTGRNERLLAINKLLSRADITARKLNTGELTRKEDRKILRNKPALLAEKKVRPTQHPCYGTHPTTRHTG